MSEQREHYRVRPSLGDGDILFITGKDRLISTKGRVQDVSRSGAFLWECYTEENTAALSFLIKNKKQVDRNCSIVRKDLRDNHWTAVRFDRLLSEFEVKRIKGGEISLHLPGDKSTCDLANIDRAEVFREANQIKTCSSNYFIWCMGLIVPFTMAVWALVLAGKLNAVSASSSMIGIIIVYCVAVFSNLEKTRAINKREGFIAALDYYLRNKEGPMNYRGWVNLKHCIGECRARIKSNLCPLVRDGHIKATCHQIGKNKSHKIREKKRVLPSILDSFVSLTSFFYGFIFIGLSILTLISFANTWQTLYSIPSPKTIMWFVVGFGGSIFLLRQVYLLIGIFLTVLVTLTGGVIYTKEFLINMSTGGIGMIIGAIGWLFFKQLYALRKGNYSFELYTHAWLEIFENCLFLPEDATEKHPETSKLKKYINWMQDKLSLRTSGVESKPI